jgi:hypothetical protein
MPGSVRFSSLVGLLFFAGWSALVNARERLSPQRVVLPVRPAERHAALPAATDRLLWN